MFLSPLASIKKHHFHGEAPPPPGELSISRQGRGLAGPIECDGGLFLPAGVVIACGWI